MSNSFVQGILNRRLGIQKVSEPEKVEQPNDGASSASSRSAQQPEVAKEEQQKVQPKAAERSETSEAKLKTELPKVTLYKKNSRNAGRKPHNDVEYEKKRQAAVARLTKGNMDDLQAVNELKDSASKDELAQEIKNTKKKLQLLSDAVLFSDK